MPHTLNFRALAPEQIDLLIATMAAAAHADGGIDDSEKRQLPLALELVGANADELRRLDAELADPRPLSGLLDDVKREGLGAHAYAAALLSINRAGRVNEAFMSYLSLRLGLLPDVADSLARRYRS